MNTNQAPICGLHRISKEWRQTTFEYQEDGISIRVPGVYAWVCPSDNEPSFTSETVDELIPHGTRIDRSRQARQSASFAGHGIYREDPLTPPLPLIPLPDRPDSICSIHFDVIRHPEDVLDGVCALLSINAAVFTNSGLSSW